MQLRHIYIGIYNSMYRYPLKLIMLTLLREIKSKELIEIKLILF